MSRIFVTLPVMASLALVSSPATAHTFSAWGAGFSQGAFHPILGLDHILAMVGAGFWAGQIGGRAVWLMPIAFVGAMLGGGALGLGGISLPGAEIGTAGSVVLFGLLIALHTKMPIQLSMGCVAFFAVFHGVAHGAEAPAAAQPILYCLGFVMATALLHLVGIGLSTYGNKLLPRAVDRGVGRVVGLATGVLGLGLLLTA